MAKRIVHVLSSFKIGGAERFVLDLGEVQQNLGDEILVFSCNAERDPLVDEAEKLSFNHAFSCGSRWQDYRKVVSYLKPFTDSVFQIHSPAALRYFSPILPLLRLYGVRLVYTRHGLNPLPDMSWSRVHAWARLFIHQVTFVSQAGLEVFHKRFGWRRSVLKAISNGIYVPELASHSRQEGTIRLGSVGRMVALKGQRDLVTAVAALEKRVPCQLEIHFFGDGPEQASLQSQVAQQLTSTHVEFHGMELDRDKVYDSFDILVVCSEQEGLSLAIMEAMARLVPVVATSVGDSPKLVIDDLTGFLYSYGDVEALIARLASLIQDPAAIEKLGEQARHHIRENFSLESTNAQYQQSYSGQD